MKIELEIGNIDYESLASVIMPIINEKAEQKAGKLGGMLIGKSVGKAAEAMLGKMPEEKKEEYLISLINKYSPDISKELEKSALDNRLYLNIENIRAWK